MHEMLRFPWSPIAKFSSHEIQFLRVFRFHRLFILSILKKIIFKIAKFGA